MGKRLGIMAIVYTIIAEAFFAPSGVWPFITVLSLFFAGIAGFRRSTILATIATGITTLHIIFFDELSHFLTNNSLAVWDISIVAIPYLFAITGIITGTIRNRSQGRLSDG